MQTTLTEFAKPEFSVVRQHEEFVWLHDRFEENEDYAGIVVSMSFLTGVGEAALNTVKYLKWQIFTTDILGIPLETGWWVGTGIVTFGSQNSSLPNCMLVPNAMIPVPIHCTVPLIRILCVLPQVQIVVLLVLMLHFVDKAQDMQTLKDAKLFEKFEMT